MGSLLTMLGKTGQGGARGTRAGLGNERRCALEVAVTVVDPEGQHLSPAEAQGKGALCCGRSKESLGSENRQEPGWQEEK